MDPNPNNASASGPGKRPPRGRQYQTLAFVALAAAATIVTSIENTTHSSQVFFKGRFQYQAHTEPAFVPPAAEINLGWFQELETPVRVKIDPRSVRALEASDGAIQVPFVPQAVVDLDSWFQELETPVRVRFTPRHAVVLSVDPTADVPIGAIRALPFTSAASIRFVQSFQYPSLAYSPFVEEAETVTVDKWVYPWTEPVRSKPGLKRHLIQDDIGPVLDDETQIINNFESRWHFPWSEPVRIKRGLRSDLQQFIAHVPVPEVDVDSWLQELETPGRPKRLLTSAHQAVAYSPIPEVDVDSWYQELEVPAAAKRGLRPSAQPYLAYTPFTAEVVDVDMWFQEWETPVPAKRGLRTSLQQAAIGPVLDDETQIINTFESRWHYPWSEPVRQKPGIKTYLIDDLILGPVQTPEFVTVDKWIYAWSEPVRQRPGIKRHLIQDDIAPILDPDTQISEDFESRWHFPWSEPVRIKRPLLTAQQAFTAAPATSVFETVTVDKWIYPWTDPVRQKIGLKTNLQSAFIGLTLNPETQIIQGYESRWHFAWSEPVRTRRIPTALQVPAYVDDNFTPEAIFVDKWTYPWSEPVRQKIGLKTHLQQAFIAPVLNPETQIIQGFESRWHQPWSEPVRFRRFPTAEQPFFAAPATSVFETIYADKWIYPWSEPVRQKIGLKTHLQQAFIGLTLNPETQIIQGFESRWHQPWSEPTRRRASVASQPSFAWGLFTPAAVNVESWHVAWQQPARKRVELRTALQQPLFAPVIPQLFVGAALSSPVAFRHQFQYPSYTISPFFAPEVVTQDKWFARLTEPVRFRRFPTAEQPAFFAPSRVIAEVVNLDKWFASLSLPVRHKIWLKAYLEAPTFVAPVIPRLFIGQALSSPVIFPQTFLYQSYAISMFPPATPALTVTLQATEVNTDSAFFGVTVYNAVPAVTRVPTTVVSIKEIAATRTADVSLEEAPAIDNASVSIEET